MKNEFVKENIEVVFLSRKHLKGDIAFDKGFSVAEMTKNLTTALDVAEESFTITFKGQGLSNLYPL